MGSGRRLPLSGTSRQGGPRAGVRLPRARTGVVAPEPSRLYDMAAAALTAVHTYHDGTLPERQFVSAGPPAWDCELLAVHVERTEGYEGDVATVTAQPMSS